MVSCSILQGADKKLLELSEQRAGGMEILVNQALTKKYLVNLSSNSIIRAFFSRKSDAF